MEKSNEADKMRVGESLRLTCKGDSGSPPATIKWYRNGVVLDSVSSVEDGTSVSHLDIIVKEEDNGAEYVCESSNLEETFNTYTVLFVEEDDLPPYKNVMAPQVVTVEDETTFLPCIKTQEKVKMDWYDVDIDTQLTSGSEVLSDDPSNFQPLTVDGVMGLVVLAGFVDTRYGCTVDGKRVGNTTVNIIPRYLIGEGSLERNDLFEDTEAQISMNEGDPLSLNCTVEDISNTLVRWRRYPGSRLLAQNDICLSQEDDYIIEISGNSNILSVTQTDIKHSGSYICQIVVNEDIYTKNFTVIMDEITVTNISDDTHIECYSPDGSGVKFLFGEQDILNSSSSSNGKYNLYMEVDVGRGAVYTLVITNTTLEDEGLYVCMTLDSPLYALREIFIQVGSEDDSLYTTTSSNESVTEIRPTDMITTTEESILDLNSTLTIEEDFIEVTTTSVDLIPEMTTNFDFFPEMTTFNFDLFPEITTTSRETSSVDYTTTSPMFTFVPYTEQPVEYSTMEDIDSSKVTTEGSVEEIVYETVSLPCGNYVDANDITWKRDDELLFIGTIDLAAVPGLSITPIGELKLDGMHREIRDGKAYKCYVFDIKTFEDVWVATYYVRLEGIETIVQKIPMRKVGNLMSPPLTIEDNNVDIKFEGLRDDEVAVVANSQRVGQTIADVLENGGLSVRLLNTSFCRRPNNTRGWDGAQDALEECENYIRSSSFIKNDQSVFIGIDFFVELAPSSWFAVTKLYVHNVKKNILANVFGPSVPVPSNSIIASSDSDQPALILVSEAWWDSVQGTANTVGNALTASILALQETYQNKIKKEET